METIKDRLYSFLDKNGIRPSAFERTCNLANGFCSKISDKVTDASLKLIKIGYPNLNINWLKTGEGEMLVELPSAKEQDSILVLVRTLGEFIEISKQNAEINRINAEANKLNSENLERLISIIESNLDK